MGKDQSLICRKALIFPLMKIKALPIIVTDLCPPMNIRFSDRQIFVLNFKGCHLGTSLKLFSAAHRESDTRFSASSFFHSSVFPGPLSTSFQIFCKNLRRYLRMNVYQRYCMWVVNALSLQSLNWSVHGPSQNCANSTVSNLAAIHFNQSKSMLLISVLCFY